MVAESSHDVNGCLPSSSVTLSALPTLCCPNEELKSCSDMMATHVQDTGTAVKLLQDHEEVAEHQSKNCAIYAVIDKDAITKKELIHEIPQDLTTDADNVDEPIFYVQDSEPRNSFHGFVGTDNLSGDQLSHQLCEESSPEQTNGKQSLDNDDRRRCPPIPRPFSAEHNLNISRCVDDFSPAANTQLRNYVSAEDMLTSCNATTTNGTSFRELDHYHANTRYPGNNMVKSLPHMDRYSSSPDSPTGEAELKRMLECNKTHRRTHSHESFDKTFLRPGADSNSDRSSASSGKNNTSIRDEIKDTLRGLGELGLSNSTLDKSDEDLESLLSSRGDVFRKSSNGNTHGNDVNEMFLKSRELEHEGLPEGWQEVVEGAETYYWHIWTGTIQYERPVWTPTPNSSSSRSISPFSGNESANSSRTSSLSDPYEERTGKSACLSPSPEVADKSKVVSFPVHSMGWMTVDEQLMSPAYIGDTVNKCIATLAEKRMDLWNVSETWANGEDMKLVLEGETLKLVEAKTKRIIHIQPIAKMRVWGVGRIETRDFAYIARDPSTGKHKCHMFRCHGHLSARSITTALHGICNRVLDEKRKAKEYSDSPAKRTVPSDLMKPPVKSNTSFNERPYAEQKKCFTARYVGSSDVIRSAGIDVINKTVNNLKEGKEINDWGSVLVEVTTSEIRAIDCSKQETTLEHRVRFISFLGVAHDERFGAYIVASGKDRFVCNVFFCAPHAGILTKAIEEACKLRFEKMLDGKTSASKTQQQQQQQQPQHQEQQPLEKRQQQQQQIDDQKRDTRSEHGSCPVTEPETIVAKAVFNPTAEIGHSPTPVPPPARSGVREKTKVLTSSIAGVFSKFNKRDSKKKDEAISTPTTPMLGPNEHLVKYFGSLAVDIGTGVDTVQTAVDGLAGGEMMLGYIEILSDCVSLSDSQRTALSKRFFDFNTISYCGMTSDRRHFGIIISRGKGKYICHVFEEYKVNCGEIVSAIHEVL